MQRSLRGRPPSSLAHEVEDGLPEVGFPGQLVADGEAEIGVGTLQGLIAIAGIDVVGPLPGDLQDTLVFTAAILASASQADAGKAFIDFLRGA